MIKINGENYQVSQIRLTEIMKELGYGNARVAVEVNEEIIPRKEHESCILKDGDVVEIVSFVGGG